MENGGKMRERQILEGLLSGTKEGIGTFLNEYGWYIRKAVDSAGVVDPAFTLEELYWMAIEHFLENREKIIKAFKGNSQFHTYLYVVLYRFTLRTQKVRERLNAVKTICDFPPMNGKDDGIFSTEEKRALKKAISQLRPNDQVFVRMLFYENRSTMEMMNHFKWTSKNTVYSQKNKINAKLKKLIRRILQIKRQA
jgi:RNA polymerase sigma factor (sigma-70 family)